MKEERLTTTPPQEDYDFDSHQLDKEISDARSVNKLLKKQLELEEVQRENRAIRREIQNVRTDENFAYARPWYKGVGMCNFN